MQIFIFCTILLLVKASKPGTCPVPTGFGICAEMCNGDESCPGSEKCCSNGCGHTCQIPVTQTQQICPSPAFGPADCAVIRFAPCRDDSECRGSNEKCCYNGCGNSCADTTARTCRDITCGPGTTCRMSRCECPPNAQCLCPPPIPECIPTSVSKPGVCPPRPAIGTCVEMCSGDDACPGSEKCCSNGCGHTCQNPEGLSQQPCPSPAFGPADCAVIRFAPCRDDSECQNTGERCCFNGCGSSCARTTEPPPPSNIAIASCQAVQPCQGGLECRLQNLGPVGCLGTGCVIETNCFARNTVCPDIRCPITCPFGVLVDENGCPSRFCACSPVEIRSCEIPSIINCGPSERCEMRSAPCDAPGVCFDKPQCVDVCSNNTCAPGTRCRARQVQCFRAPCYPVPECEPDTRPPNGCEALVCRLACPRYKKDANNCEICECESGTPPCPVCLCRAAPIQLDTLDRDENDCPVCDCEPTTTALPPLSSYPCQNIDCPPGSRCGLLEQCPDDCPLNGDCRSSCPLVPHCFSGNTPCAEWGCSKWCPYGLVLDSTGCKSRSCRCNPRPLFPPLEIRPPQPPSCANKDCPPGLQCALLQQCPDDCPRHGDCRFSCPLIPHCFGGGSPCGERGCAINCPYGLVLDSQGCLAGCRCNPAPLYPPPPPLQPLPPSTPSCANTVCEPDTYCGLLEVCPDDCPETDDCRSSCPLVPECFSAPYTCEHWQCSNDCPYGYVFDNRGCKTKSCRCNPGPLYPPPPPPETLPTPTCANTVCQPGSYCGLLEQCPDDCADTDDCRSSCPLVPHCFVGPNYCDQFTCLNQCPYGYVFDNSGCRTRSCRCNPGPLYPLPPPRCEDIQCSENQTCELLPIPCFPGQVPCHPQPFCRYQDHVITKPGTCVRPTGRGFCQEICSGDKDCPGELKCCSNGCGRTCQIPKRQIQETCPQVRVDPDICAVIFFLPCQRDSDCREAGQKCCANGCGMTCMSTTPTTTPTPRPSPPPLTCANILCRPNHRCEMEPCTPGQTPCVPRPVCRDEQTEPCNLPMVRGPCEAYMPRYAYNTSTRRCERFIFGGCQGNRNNFNTLNQCQESCERAEPGPPPQPSDCRPCRPCLPGFQLDDSSSDPNGCSTCRCTALRSILGSPCRPMNCPRCPPSHVRNQRARNSFGCPICACIPQDLGLTQQPEQAEQGRVPSLTNCMTCRPCLFGFEREQASLDSDGCPTCRCRRITSILGTQCRALSCSPCPPRYTRNPRARNLLGCPLCGQCIPSFMVSP